MHLIYFSSSIQDFISNIVSAKQGFPNMAMSACFGGPLFSKFKFLLLKKLLFFK